MIVLQLVLVTLRLLGGQTLGDIPTIYSQVPESYAYLTLHSSGHTFKFLRTAPIFGKGGKRLGLGLSYVNETSDVQKLEAAAQELFDYLRPIAEAQNERAIVIFAYLS